MVIMDALDEEYKEFDEDALPADTREHIRAGLVKLHQAHFVHGDVRDVNMMVEKDGKPEFMLVDLTGQGSSANGANLAKTDFINILRTSQDLSKSSLPHSQGRTSSRRWASGQFVNLDPLA